MKEIKVEIPRSNKFTYTIKTGKKLLNELERHIPEISSGRRIALITDSNVKSLYGNDLIATLKQYNESSMLFSFKAGEKNKNRRTKEMLEDEMLIAGFARDSVILALGGGVTGDLAGFIASTYYRGIPYYQLPTTIIAMTDSSVGGKTGVDTIYGKNLIGTFYQPWGVIIDISTLATLPDEEYFSGLAEVIKYGAIMDEELFQWLEDHVEEIRKRDQDTAEHFIVRSCENKVKVVVSDEKESGLRKILNFGHTIGHAIEVTNDYRVKHGVAVAYGMIIEAMISQKMGLLETSQVTRLHQLTETLVLSNIEVTPRIDPERILSAVKYDKKVKGGKPLYVLLERIGKHIDDVAVPVEDRVVVSAIEEFTGKWM